MAEKRILHTSPDPALPFDVVISDSEVQKNHVDGMAALALGMLVSKVIFYRHDLVSSLEEGREQREIVLELTMPTEALVELSVHVLSNLSREIGKFETLIPHYVEKLRRSVESSTTAASEEGKSK